MPHDDLLTPVTTAVETAADLAGALSALDEPAVVVADRAAAAALAALGVVVAEDAWPTSGTEVVATPAGAHGVARVLGAAEITDAGSARRLGAAVGRAGIDTAGVVVAVAAGEHLAPLLEGVVLGSHRPATYGGGDVVRPGARPAPTTVVVAPGADPAEVTGAVVAARASLVARNLANAPSNHKDPAWMADRARAVAQRHGLAITVRDETALASEGFGGLLAVGGGSASPPRLVEICHAPETAPASPHVVLVGKGITFDTGGISVKPAEGMVAMRTDMSGAAIALAVVDAVAELALPVRLTVLLPLAENSFGEASYRPGDVITPYGGRRTVEVTNTDAEGRIVLADALAYADQQLLPDVLVDIATLTGAARVALARSMAAVFGTDDDLTRSFVEAGEGAGEPLWRLPLYADYRPFLDSAVADLDNAPGKAGAVTAALFLQEFVGERPWVHLDIAGPGRSDADTGLLSKGATGYGARALLAWLKGCR